MSELKNMAWVQKYRPKKFENIMLSQTLRKRFESQTIDSNLILSGPYGCGKTTLYQILSKGHTVLELNGSTQNSINDVRNIIEPFCQTNSILNGSKKKVVFIDEGDRMTPEAQKGLKALTEKNESNVWFIINTNYPEKLQELYSRFEIISFIPTNKDEIIDLKIQYMKRVVNITKNEGYKIGREAATKLVESNYPDFRKITGTLYAATKLTKEDKIISEEMIDKNIIVTNTSLYEILLTEHRESALYQFVRSEFTGQETEALKSLGEPFLDFLYNHENEMIKQKVMGASMIVQRYTYESQSGSTDQLLPLLACVSALSKLLK